MKIFADKIIDFNRQLAYSGYLPKGIKIMNPFKDNKEALVLSSTFYKKYYNDNNPRHIILGVNPGRFGAGLTGIPFTDPKRIVEKCNLNYTGEIKHEPSSVFVYEMIEAFGGVKEFYNSFYINNVCPLGFTSINERGKDVNYNYYDSSELKESVYYFINESIQKHIKFGIETDIAFCFGTGKNEQFLRQLNLDKKYFKKIVSLEHPRYIMQYKAKFKAFYIDKYIKAFNQIK